MGGGGLGGLDLLSVDMVRCSASEGMAAEALALLPGALGWPPFPSVVMALSVRLSRRQVRSLIQIYPVRFLQSRIIFTKRTFLRIYYQGLRKLFLTVSWETFLPSTTYLTVSFGFFQVGRFRSLENDIFTACLYLLPINLKN